MGHEFSCTSCGSPVPHDQIHPLGIQKRVRCPVCGAGWAFEADAGGKIRSIRLIG